MTDSVVVEGYARLREGKKWKTRWLVLRKPSPVADCLVLLVYKDKSKKVQGNKERASVTLEEICGLEAGQWYEGVAFTLTILCLNQVAILGFDSRDALQAWDIRLRYSLGEVHRFSVGVLPGTKLESGPATLHLCNNVLALSRDIPPVIIGHWNLPDLRRYGPVPHGFVFEGGTRCGYWAGVFLLASAESEQISFLFDCIVRGISPSRGPFGLRPVLPELSSSQTSSEEKLNHEAEELEKRLSMLSHGSSTVSSTYFPSAGGDDHSISGSSDTSDTSHSDCSLGSRLTIWAEPASNPPGNVNYAKVPLQIVEKLSASHGSGNRPASKTPRQLQEIGRQSSSDSGIATGSHSSYSGSFSSYTGSLDITSGEDFGSVFSLPPHLAQELSPCACITDRGHEYQVPMSPQYLYDTPRNLLQEASGDVKYIAPSTSTKNTTAPLNLTTESEKGVQMSATASEGHLGATEKQSMSEHLQGLPEECKIIKKVPSSDSCHTYSSTSASKTIVTICSVCGGFKGTLYTLSSSSVTPAVPVKTALQSVAGPGSIQTTEVPRVKMSEESLLIKRGEKLDSLLPDLLSVPSVDRQPEAKVYRLNLYESMSPALGNELTLAPAVPSQASQKDKRATIYENCMKCQAVHCHPPPRALPSKMYSSMDISTFQTFPTGSRLKESQVHDYAADGELHQSLRDVDGQNQYEEMNGWTVTSEDKKLHSKEERCRADPAYEIMESRMMEKNSEAEEKSKYELMGSYGQKRFLHEAEVKRGSSEDVAELNAKILFSSAVIIQSPATNGVTSQWAQRASLKPKGKGAVFVFPPENPLSKGPRNEGATYVNIPVSPTSKKHLNYMELELQELGHSTRGTVSHLSAQRKSSTRYAQIDISATETAHKVGTQHALGRQEGLHTLELRRKGTPR